MANQILSVVRSFAYVAVAIIVAALLISEARKR